METCGISVVRQLCEILCPVVGQKISQYEKQFISSMRDSVKNEDWQAAQVLMNAKTVRRKSSFDGKEISVPNTPAIISTGPVSKRGAATKKEVVEEPARQPATVASKDSMWLTKSGRYLYDQGITLITDCRKVLSPGTVE